MLSTSTFILAVLLVVIGAVLGSLGPVIAGRRDMKAVPPKDARDVEEDELERGRVDDVEIVIIDKEEAVGGDTTMKTAFLFVGLIRDTVWFAFATPVEVEMIRGLVGGVAKFFSWALGWISFGSDTEEVHEKRLTKRGERHAKTRRRSSLVSSCISRVDVDVDSAGDLVGEDEKVDDVPADDDDGSDAMELCQPEDFIFASDVQQEVAIGEDAPPTSGVDIVVAAGGCEVGQISLGFAALKELVKVEEVGPEPLQWPVFSPFMSAILQPLPTAKHYSVLPLSVFEPRVRELYPVSWAQIIWNGKPRLPQGLQGLQRRDRWMFNLDRAPIQGWPTAEPIADVVRVDLVTRPAWRQPEPKRRYRNGWVPTRSSLAAVVFFAADGDDDDAGMGLNDRFVYEPAKVEVARTAELTRQFAGDVFVDEEIVGASVDEAAADAVVGEDRDEAGSEGAIVAMLKEDDVNNRNDNGDPQDLAPVREQTHVSPTAEPIVDVVRVDIGARPAYQSPPPTVTWPEPTDRRDRGSPLVPCVSVAVEGEIDTADLCHSKFAYEAKVAETSRIPGLWQDLIREARVVKEVARNAVVAEVVEAPEDLTLQQDIVSQAAVDDGSIVEKPAEVEEIVIGAQDPESVPASNEEPVAPRQSTRRRSPPETMTPMHSGQRHVSVRVVRR